MSSNQLVLSGDTYQNYPLIVESDIASNENRQGTITSDGPGTGTIGDSGDGQFTRTAATLSGAVNGGFQNPQQQMEISVRNDNGDVVPRYARNSRSITPNVARGPSSPLHNGHLTSNIQKEQFGSLTGLPFFQRPGPADYNNLTDSAQFQINQVTQNPIPTDIYAFKRLAELNARGSRTLRSKRASIRQKTNQVKTIYRNRNNQPLFTKKKKQISRSFKKGAQGNANDVVNQRLQKLMHYEGGDQSSGYNTQNNTQSQTISQIQSMQQQDTQGTQQPPHIGQGVNNQSGFSLQTKNPVTEGPKSTTPTQHGSRFTEINRNSAFDQQLAVRRAQRASQEPMQSHGDGGEMVPAPVLSQSSNNITTTKNSKAFGSRQASHGGGIVLAPYDDNQEKISTLKETYNQVAKYQATKNRNIEISFSAQTSKQAPPQERQRTFGNQSSNLNVAGRTSPTGGGQVTRNTISVQSHTQLLPGGHFRDLSAQQRDDAQTLSRLQQNLEQIRQVNKDSRKSNVNSGQGKRQRHQSANITKKQMGYQPDDASRGDTSAMMTGHSAQGGKKSLGIQDKFSQTHTKSQTISIYNNLAHSKPSGYYYDQHSTKIPPFYNRTGPGQYFIADQQQEPVDTKAQSMSRHANPHGQKFGMGDYPRGFYEHNLPHHRFTDYSKIQLNNHILTCQKNGTPVRLHQYRGDVQRTQLESTKKLDVLNPSLSQIRKNKKVQSFVRTKRPELFPVKDEHSNPCSYLRSLKGELAKRNVAKTKVRREFQEDPDYKSPGPAAYKPACDPGKELKACDRPLSNQKSFIDIQKTTIPNQKRETIFGGKFKLYIDSGFTKDLSNAGQKLGPGPATMNQRDINLGLKTFHHKKTSSVKTGLNLEQRYIGQALPCGKYPGPGFYQVSDNQYTVNNSSVFRGTQSFQKQRRIIDVIKFGEGRETLIEKGLF